jgi:tetratricopeptide (TPR) repeat protein
VLGDYQQALGTFQEGLSIATRSSERRVESYLLWSMGDLLRDRGNFPEASHIYRRALEVIGEDEPTLQCNVLISLSTLQRWQCNLDEALTLAVEAERLADTYNARL